MGASLPHREAELRSVRVGPLAAGASPAYFRFDVDCEGQDAIVTLTKRGGGDLVGIVGGSDRREGPTGIDPSTDSSGMDSSDASAFRRSGVGSQVTLAARRGAPPSLDDGGYLVATAAESYSSLFGSSRPSS